MATSTTASSPPGARSSAEDPSARRVLRIAYWVTTGILSAAMLVTATSYIFKHDRLVEVFASLGYPGYLVYPLAAAKILGVIAILGKPSPTLKEWAYAGFFFNFILAFTAHGAAADGLFLPSVVALALLMASYALDRKLEHRVGSR